MKTKKLLVVTAFIACGFTANAQDTIRMTFVEEEYYMYSKSFRIAATANEQFIIDWGNGYDVDTVTGTGGLQTLIHTYNNHYTQYTITITGLTNDCAFTDFDCSSKKVTSLNVHNCPYLSNINCSNNLLTDLYVCNHPHFISLNCSNNLLTDLQVCNCKQLRYLNCSNNKLTTLNVVSNSKLLGTLDCSNNQLTTLNVNNYPTEALICYGNQLTNLEVKGNNWLFTLNCSNNQLVDLDVSNCTRLQSLDCSNNQLINLDVSNCTGLRNLDYSNNQLTSLSLRKGVFTVICCYENHLQLSDLYNTYKALSSSGIGRLGTQRFALREVKVLELIDYTSQSEIANISTIFKIEKNGMLASPNDYKVSSAGRIYFKDTGYYTVTMTNSAIVSQASYPAQVIAEFNVVKDSVNIVTEVAGCELQVVSYEIFDILGRKIERCDVQGIRYEDIILSSYPSGLYIIQLQTNKGIITKKIIKY